MIIHTADRITYRNHELLELAKTDPQGLRVKPTVPGCYICKNDVVLLDHHVKYKPQIIIGICEKCHENIHSASWGWNPSERYDERADYSSEYRDYVWYTGRERDSFYSTERPAQNIRRYCNICDRNTLVYPPDNSRCSGCGKTYPLITNDEKPDIWGWKK